MTHLLLPRWGLLKSLQILVAFVNLKTKQTSSQPCRCLAAAADAAAILPHESVLKKQNANLGKQKKRLPMYFSKSERLSPENHNLRYSNNKQASLYADKR